MNKSPIQSASNVAAPQLHAHALLQRTCAACGSHTMGGACTDCEQDKKKLQRKARFPGLQAKLRIGASDDPLELEADRISEQVLSSAPGAVAPGIQRVAAGSAPVGDAAPASVDRVLASAGRPLEASLRHDMERRFERDFSRVRVHTDGAADRSARDVDARAYTAGHQLVFGAGQFAPSTREGRRLIAHELTHVVQQMGAPAAGPVQRILQRVPIEIVPAGSKRPIADDLYEQRRAAASCDINCDTTSLGTLHVMPLFQHASRGAPLAGGAAGANGVGAELHFIRNTTPAPAGSSCAACTGFKIIQILKTNQTSDARAKESYVDNAGHASPFYGDAYRSGTGLHTISAGYVDAGEQVKTTHSIYDRPFRAAGALAGMAGKDFFWNAESCVTCIKPGKHKVLGCATYGFKRNWDAKTSTHGPVQTVGPGCLAKPSAHFVSTLTTDSSTSTYKFET